MGLAPAAPSRALKAALNGIEALATIATAIQERLFTGSLHWRVACLNSQTITYAVGRLVRFDQWLGIPTPLFSCESSLTLM